MSNSPPYAVCFAGVPGTSKSIIAYYLSSQFGLPILSNDSLRYEVKEDMLVAKLVLPEDLIKKGINQPKVLAEFERRLSQRRKELLKTGRSIIFDASVDRRWPEIKSELQAAGYSWFMISMELSRQFLEKLFGATDRKDFLPQLDDYFKNHQQFLKRYRSDINLEIDDANFQNRLKIAATELQKFIDGLAN